MTFLPIVDRQLRVQARQKSTHRLRLAGAAVAIALVSFILIFNKGFYTPGSIGHWMFAVMAWLAFIYCLVSGAGNTADCLSEEKRAGTLGLLFLTDLKGYDVVLGKLLATSLNNFYGLLAIFPALAITLCVGGVTAGEFWRQILQLTNMLFFSLALGMFVSALSRNEQRAWAAALGGLLISAPGLVLVFASGVDANSNPKLFWSGLCTIHSLGWGLLALASAILPRAWQDQAERGERKADRRKQKTETGKKLLPNPVLWLAERRASSVGQYLWMAVLIAGGGGLIVPVMVLGAAPATGTLLGCALGLHYLLVVWAAFQASYIVAEARSSGTLEMLLSTPLTAGQIIDGYFLGLKQVFIPPIAALFVLELMIVIEQIFLIDPPEGILLFFPFFGAAVFCMLLFISDLLAVGRFGMWMGLSSKKPNQAFAKTVLYVMILPLISGCACFFMPLVWLLKNAFFMNYGESRMRQHFRTLLIEGAAEKRERGQLPSVLSR